MKNMLLLLCALIFAAPVWAADTAGAPANPPASASSAQAAPAAQPGKEALKKAKKKKKKAKSAANKGVTVACPQTCRVMACPPPGGVSKLCCPVVPYTQTCP